MHKAYQRKPGGGCKPKPARLGFEAIVYVLCTGCHWKTLPTERFGSASAIHKRFLEWQEAGFFEALWRAGLAEYEEMEGIASVYCLNEMSTAAGQDHSATRSIPWANWERISRAIAKSYLESHPVQYRDWRRGAYRFSRCASLRWRISAPKIVSPT